MGVPFFFERDGSAGGRAIKVHEFPNSDTPYVEDLGRKTRTYSGTAYVTGNDADIQAVGLETIFDTKGPGLLVVPIAGPVSVHCDSFERTCDKDKFGYIAFTVKFVRDGAQPALVSVLLFGQLIFDAADTMASALANLFPDTLTLANTAGYVTAAAIDAVDDVVASIEQVRTSNPVDPDTSAQVAAANAAILTAAPLLIASGDPANPAAVANLLASVPALDRSCATYRSR
jgi:prophage DNA circulation protein